MNPPQMPAFRASDVCERRRIDDRDARESAPRHHSLWVCFACLFLISIVAFFHRDQFLLDLLGNLIQLAGLAMAGLAWLRAMKAAPRRSMFERASQQLALGLAVGFLGQCLVMFSELVLKQPSYGTVADGFFVLGSAIFLRGLFQLAVSLQPAGVSLWFGLRTAVLPVLVCASLFCFLIWNEWSPQRPVAWKLLDVTYPILDLAYLALAVSLINLSSRKSLTGSRVPLFFVSSALALVAGDLLLMSNLDFESLSFRIVDFLYCSSYFLINLSAEKLTRSASDFIPSPL